MAYATIEARPIGGALGAEIHGVDLSRSLDDRVIGDIRQALLDHLVIFFRDQDISPAQHLAFAKRFGEVIEYPMVKGLADYREIVPVVKLEHETVNFGGLWHSDTTYMDIPPMGSILLARQLPPVGGDTMFANMYLAYETLSDGMKRMLDGLTGISSSAKGSAASRASGRPCPSGNRAQGALCQYRAYGGVQGHDRGRERADPQLSVRTPGPARIHLPVPLAAGFDRLLGQPLQPAQSDQRLSRLSPRNAPDYARWITNFLTFLPCNRARIYRRAGPAAAPGSIVP
jgi:hypothetical protein